MLSVPFPVYVPQRVSEFSSFSPPPVPVFRWNPDALSPAFTFPSFLEPGLICFKFYVIVPPHLIQTINIQPSVPIHIVECEPWSPPALASVSISQIPLFLSLLTHPKQISLSQQIPRHPCHQDPSPQHCKLLKSSGQRRCIIFMLFSHNLLGMVFTG